MVRSIQDIWSNIKSAGVNLIANDRVFYNLLIIVIAAAAFGLGRLSVVLEGRELLPSINSTKGESEQAMPKSSDWSPLGAGPTTGKATTAQEATVAKVYVASKNSTKYHLPGCSGAKRITEANKIWFSSKAEAEATGRTPAANCPGI